jgi:hypothetical protein
MTSDQDIVRWSQIRSWIKRFLIWYLIYLVFFSLYDFEYPLFGIRIQSVLICMSALMAFARLK